MCNRLESIPVCDRQTDGQTDRQTSCHGIVRAMHTRRAVKMPVIVIIIVPIIACLVFDCLMMSVYTTFARRHCQIST